MKSSMSIFRLQQFVIDQSKSGMKICSDSLLFGALIPVEGAQCILDIGAGTGILSLMQAQKINALKTSASNNSITAVELTHAAAEEAQKNVDNSPWTKQIEVIEQDIQSFANKHDPEKALGYDLVICNPPFFAKQSKTASNNPLRHTARHNDSLSFEDLIISIDQLLSEKGKLFLLLPSSALHDVCFTAKEKGFYPVRQIDIAESEKHISKVAVLEFERGQHLDKTLARELWNHSFTNPSSQGFPLRQRLNKFQQTNVHSKEVRELLQPFLLRYR